MVFDPISAIGAFGSLAGGAGSLIGALGGGGGAPAGDYASLYAAQLSPGNVALTTAAQQLAALTGPYLQSLNTNTALQASQALGQFNQAAYKDQTNTDLLAGVAGALQSSLIGNQDLADESVWPVRSRNAARSAQGRVQCNEYYYGWSSAAGPQRC
jgi:hypothetical protein